MDNKHHPYAYLLQAGYTHKEIKEFIHEKQSFTLDELWEKTKKNELDHLGESRQVKIREKMATLTEERIGDFLANNEVSIVPYFDELYPEKLRQIRHAPSFLYVQGTLKHQARMIGVVGSRRHTHYADKILRKILPEIIESGFGIVSGGANGVDALGHSITLENNGYTIAVLGTGIDFYYPHSNKKLFESIRNNGGAIVSHFPLSTSPELYNFPIRNEIVAAISEGVLIPEAGLSSGTLITAQLALEHGRDVFAVPGDIDRPTSEGTNMLIATGQAKCVRGSNDILEEYFETKGIGTGMNPILKIPPQFSNEGEKQVYEKIESGYNTVDELMTQIDSDMSDVLTHIAMLEIAGHVKMDEMGKYQIR